MKRNLFTSKNLLSLGAQLRLEVLWLRRRNAILALYLTLTVVTLVSIPFLQGFSFLRAHILVISGAAFMFLTIGVVTYSVIFPETSEEKQKPSSEEGFSAAFQAVMRVLQEDEKEVCRAILKEGGTVLQKDVRYMTGLSKVRTYRVSKRLTDRGVITISKDGRLNRLSLAPWLCQNTKDKNR